MPKLYQYFGLIDYPGRDFSEAQVIKDALSIVCVEYLGGYRFAIDFDDGTKQDIDFNPFLINAQYLEIRALLGVGRFSAFQAKYGDLVWRDRALYFPIEDICRNRIAFISDSKIVA